MANAIKITSEYGHCEVLSAIKQLQVLDDPSVATLIEMLTSAVDAFETQDAAQMTIAAAAINEESGTAESVLDVMAGVERIRRSVPLSDRQQAVQSYINEQVELIKQMELETLGKLQAGWPTEGVIPVGSFDEESDAINLIAGHLFGLKQPP